MGKFNFLLVEDETLIREGLKSLLQQEAFVGSISEAANKREFQKAFTAEIDFVLLDFKLGDTNGLELMQAIKSAGRPVKVIMLTGLEGNELILNLLKAGVNGIVYKLDGYNEIRKTIEKVLRNENCFTEKVLTIIQQNAHRWDNLPPVTLTFTEKEMLQALTRGLTTREISELTRMTETTIETYRVRLMKKVGVPNTAALIAYAYRNGVL
jgi:DNA-binding NarL/FixJ family response regulator